VSGASGPARRKRVTHWLRDRRTVRSGDTVRSNLMVKAIQRWTVQVLLGGFLAAASLLCLPFAAQAATLRIASAFDSQSMDPHALALLYHTRVVAQVYDSLINRDEQFRLEPALALSWEQTSPTRWRFKLRPGVVFHDGTPMTADDVVFSFERALAPPSQRSFQLQGVTSVRKVDPLTVDFMLAAPDAVLPEKLPLVAIMSKAWAVAHGVEKAQDFNGKQETYAVRHANGTGPFELVSYEPDIKVTLKRNPRWWGWRDARSGNLDGATFVPIRSDATRLAALVSGEIDLVLDPPVQDIARLRQEPQIALLTTTDLGQQYLVFDQARDTLIDGDATLAGKPSNPFKDRRVRQAVYQAINVELIARKVLHGLAVPTGALLSPRIDGSSAELDQRLPYDPAKARALLAEAGYPQGFSVTLDCVNVPWREAVCQAITAMLTQAGVRATLRSSPTNQFFPKLTGATASFMEFGWSPATDAWASLNAILHGYDPQGPGTFNGGRYRNPKLDALIDALRVEPDPARRRTMVTEALRLAADDIALVPLYRRTLAWAMNRNVKAVIWPNDIAELRFVRMP
jgi:peptide/nickel transport system substrate-binding protein